MPITDALGAYGKMYLLFAMAEEAPALKSAPTDDEQYAANEQEAIAQIRERITALATEYSELEDPALWQYSDDEIRAACELVYMRRHFEPAEPAETEE